MRRFVRILLILLAIGLFALCNGTVRHFCTETVYPFQRAAVWVRVQLGGRLGAAWHGLLEGPAPEAIAQGQAAVEAWELARLREENRVLRLALQWSAAQPMKVVAAPVWAYGGGLGVWPRLTLGIGSLRGVAPGDAVVTPEGLVGRVAEGVTAHTCEVLLLSDPGQSVAAEIPGVTRGILQGTAGQDFGESPEASLLYAPNDLLLRYVFRDVEVHEGQAVQTEGSGGMYPRGLHIGTVVEKISLPSEVLCEVRVKAAVDPTALDVVYILVKEPADER